MKTFLRLTRRYILAAVGIVFLLLVLTFGVILWAGWRESGRSAGQEFSCRRIADSMVSDGGTLAFGPEHSPAEWMRGYAWAMVLDDDGNVVWSHALPQSLARRYTAAEVARFSRWYLDDYPVFCWAEDYGLFVIGAEKGSIWKYNASTSPGMLTDLIGSILPLVLALLGIILAVCFWLSWRGAKELFALSRRDNARTQWIAGVSHDVRTPLALILGWAEQLEQDAALPAAARQKAGGIRTQSEKLRTLIDDLNLTSKLQYGAQPLRKEPFAAGPLLRELVAQFCDSPLADRCEVTLTQTDAAEHAQLAADRALLGRLLDNLLGNSVRHNARPVRITLHAETAQNRLRLTVTDDGTGYPPAVLDALRKPDPGENAPHILGLHVVEQIAAAHGGSARFEQNTPQGAKVTVELPLL